MVTEDLSAELVGLTEGNGFEPGASAFFDLLI
jgi:hypothetical protein